MICKFILMKVLQEKKVKDSAISILKYMYGEHLIVLNSIDQIEENERNILLQLRDQYISKK